MDQQMARLVILAGVAVGAVFWLIALSMYRKMAAAETVREFEATIPGKRPSEAINDLLSEGRMFAAQARLERLADNRLHIRQSAMELDIEAVRHGEGSRITAVLDDSAYTRRFQLGFGAYILILMPLAIGGVALALWHFVAASDSAAVRWQSLQVLQISHVLWPPFLIYFLWKKLREQVGNQVSNLLVYAEAESGSRRATVER
jgi:hypothetical protein